MLPLNRFTWPWNEPEEIKLQRWFRMKRIVLMAETIIQIVNENGGCVIAAAVLQAWKCNSESLWFQYWSKAYRKPARIFIAFHLLLCKEHKMLSVCVMTPKRQGWARSSPLTAELSKTEEATLGSFLPVLHGLMIYKRCYFAELTVGASQSFANAIYLTLRM